MLAVDSNPPVSTPSASPGELGIRHVVPVLDDDASEQTVARAFALRRDDAAQVVQRSADRVQRLAEPAGDIEAHAAMGHELVAILGRDPQHAH